MARIWLSAALALACAAGCGDDDKDDDTTANGGDNTNNGAANDGNGSTNNNSNGDTGEDAGSTNCTTEMYAKYKQAGFEAVNANILTNVGTVSAMNPSPIGDSFKGLTTDQVKAVETNLLAFLVKVYGGPDNYKGRSMKDSHAALDITKEQYDAFIGMVVVPALSKAGVPEKDITDCFAPPVVDPAFVADIVTK